MDVITAIRRERGKMRITINDATEVLVPLLLFRERPLSEGQPLNLEEYDQWLMVRQYRHALDKAVAALAARACSRKEIEGKLLRIGYRPCTVEMVLYKLEREHLLDDADFARQWVEARCKKLGRRRIAQELRQKGISAEQTDEALKQVDEEKQLACAASLASKALGRAKSGEDPRKTAQRIIAAIVRRGYGYDVARKALQQVMDSITEEM